MLLAPILLAAALRFPDLASRPMHADEAVHADRFGTLLEGGGYAYDPSEYHGPTLYYLTLLPAWLQASRRYVDLDEVTLRLVPAALGVALVAAHLGARELLGPAGAAVAALLAAISPAMVFYSRYFIHEMPLVLFSFGVLLAAQRYLRSPGAPPALLAGACAGLMIATKETAPLALGCMVLALALTRLVSRGPGEALAPIHGVLWGRHLGLALLVAVLVAGVLFSSFLGHPRGLVDAARAYGFYLERAQAASWHVHPWSYYLGLLIHVSSRGTPFWTEGLILVLAVIGGAGGWVKKGAGEDAKAPLPPGGPAALRFLAFYTLLMLATYSVIPYKTPWCVLGLLHGMILLAGAGAVVLVNALRGGATRTLVGVLLATAATHLGWQAFEASFRFAADPRNPYVYAHTSTDVFEVVGRLKDLARTHPDGSSMPVQVISRANLWPLPWYLRGFPRVEWWNGVPESVRTAPVVLLTPDMEPALVKKLYDLPPPGERELYVSIFTRPVELRPGVELRGYAASRLWEDHRPLEAEPPAPAGGLRE